MPPSRTSEPHAGRVALVTGATRSIGQAIATGLAERGTRIVLGDIDDVSEASDLIGATCHPAVPVTPDVSDPPLTEAARDRVTDALGRVDIGAIKRKYDPQNLFHHNANIQPAQAGGRPDNRSDISMLRAGSGQPGDAEEDAMVMPLAGRVAAAVAGGVLVLVAVSSVTVTLIVSRPVKSRRRWRRSGPPRGWPRRWSRSIRQ